MADMTKQEKQNPDQECREAGKEKQRASAASAPADSDAVQVGRAEYEELLRKAAEFAQIQDRLLRSAADFDNAKKRLAKEREGFLKFALESTLYDLLPVLDHFELALDHLEATDEKTKSIRDGFLLIQKRLSAVLAERGLKRIETVGKPFDPHLHEAVGHIVSQEKPDNLVLEEELTGYQLNGKLLRPAKVKISAREEKSLEEKSEELT